MLRYRGQYRVVYEMDTMTGKPAEFSFIPCRVRKGAKICRHNEDTLSIYIPGISTVNRLIKDNPDIFKPFQVGDSEATLLFPESLLHEVAVILKPYTKGNKVSPRSKRNIKYVKNNVGNERKTG